MFQFQSVYTCFCRTKHISYIKLTNHSPVVQKKRNKKMEYKQTNQQTNEHIKKLHTHQFVFMLNECHTQSRTRTRTHAHTNNLNAVFYSKNLFQIYCQLFVIVSSTYHLRRISKLSHTRIRLNCAHVEMMNERIRNGQEKTEKRATRM